MRWGPRWLVVPLAFAGFLAVWNWSGESSEIVSHEVLSGDSEYDQRTLFVYSTGEEYVVEWFASKHGYRQRLYEYQSGQKIHGFGPTGYRGVIDDWNVYDRRLKAAERRAEWHGRQP